MEDAVGESFEHWYRYILDTLPTDATAKDRIKNVISLVQLLVSDLKQVSRPLRFYVVVM